jgi:hypothetical protein
MDPSNETPRRDAFGLLPMRRRATPLVEEPSRGSLVAMAALYLIACGIAGFLIFGL